MTALKTIRDIKDQLTFLELLLLPDEIPAPLTKVLTQEQLNELASGFNLCADELISLGMEIKDIIKENGPLH